MSREEAIRELKIFSGTTKTRLSANFWKALEMAIKALSEEPCGDCVSREEVLKQMKEWRDCEFVKMTNPYHYLEKRIQSMSPVTPTFPKGATNGDMIKAMFPDLVNSNMDLVDAFNNVKKWWNAPYKKGVSNGKIIERY